MIIVDASIAFKWVQEDEVGRDKALNLLRKHAANLQKILVPPLFYLEVANAFVTKSTTTSESVREALKFIFDSNLNNYEPTQKDIFKAADLSKKYKTSVYDMLYAVVAKKHKAILYTADANFIKKTKFKFVKHLKEFRDLS